MTTYFALSVDPTWGRETLAPPATDRRLPVRTLIAAFAVLVVPALLLNLPIGRSIALGILGAVIAVALSCLRIDPRWTRFAPEIELAAPVAYVLISALLVGDAATLRAELIHLPIPNKHIAALLLSSTCVVWLLRGGTHFVRAVLANAAVTVPDAPNTRHGRLIGNMERLLLAGLVGIGAYQALGFLIAAKGLIRSKELEEHKFAEYFLIGTLASTAPAIAVGWLLMQVFARLW